MKPKVAEIFYLLLLPIIITISTGWMYSFNGLYGQDAHAYFGYALELSSYFDGGDFPSHFFWPIFYPLLGASLSYLFGHTLIMLQLVSALGMGLTTYYSYKLLHLNIKKEKYVPYFFVFLVLCPIVLKSSVLIMSDILCIGLIMGAWYYAFLFDKTKNGWQILPAAAFAILAINTRYAAAVLLLVPMFVILKNTIQQKKWIHLALGLLLISVLCIPHFYFKSNDPVGFVGHSWLTNWSFLNLFKRNFDTVEGSFSYLFPNIGFVFYAFFHPLFFSLGAILIFFIHPKKDFNSQFYVAVGLAVYLFFLAGIPYQNKRFLLLAMPFVGILFLEPFKRFFKLIREKFKVEMLFFVVIIFSQFGFFTYSFLTVLQRNKLEKEVAYVVSKYPQKHLYGFDMDVSLKSYGCEKKIHNMWVEEYPKFTRNSLVIFNEEKFAQQWKDKAPMNNWKLMNDKFEIREVDKFKEGWSLYELH